MFVSDKSSSQPIKFYNWTCDPIWDVKYGPSLDTVKHDELWDINKFIVISSREFKINKLLKD